MMPADAVLPIGSITVSTAEFKLGWCELRREPFSTARRKIYHPYVRVASFADGTHQVLPPPAGRDVELSPLLNAPQPVPRTGAGPDIWNLVIRDMGERNDLGYAKYGRTMRARDGRDHLVDAYQECLDMAVYLRQEIEERRMGGAEMNLPDVEAVSAKVHEAWMSSKTARGIHSRLSEQGEELMVPYDQLTEGSKDLDRQSVLAVYAAIASLAPQATPEP